MIRATAFVVSLCLTIVAQAQDRSGDDATSGQLTVMTSGTFAPVLAALAPGFQRETGISLITVRGASSGGSPTSIPNRLAADEHADVVILAKDSLDRLTDQGHIRPATRVDLVRSRIAMAVRTGADVPDISTVDAFVDAVRHAGSFGYSSSVSGTYLSTQLFPRLGIWEEIESRGVRVTDEPVGALVARGEIEIGFQQVSELLAVDGVAIVGPLPQEIQLVSIISAAVTARSTNPANARTLIEFLSSEAQSATIAGMGLEPVVVGAR